MNKDVLELAQEILQERAERMKSRPDVIPEQEKSRGMMEYKLKKNSIVAQQQQAAMNLSNLEKRKTIDNHKPNNIETLQNGNFEDKKTNFYEIDILARNEWRGEDEDEEIEYIPGEQMVAHEDYPDINCINDVEIPIGSYQQPSVTSTGSDRDSILAPYTEIDLIQPRSNKGVMMHYNPSNMNPRESVIYEPVVDVHSGYCDPNPADEKPYQGIYLQPIDGAGAAFSPLEHMQKYRDLTTSDSTNKSAIVSSSDEDDDDDDYEELRIEPREN